MADRAFGVHGRRLDKDRDEKAKIIENEAAEDFAKNRDKLIQAGVELDWDRLPFRINAISNFTFRPKRIIAYLPGRKLNIMLNNRIKRIKGRMAIRLTFNDNGEVAFRRLNAMLSDFDHHASIGCLDHKINAAAYNLVCLGCFADALILMLNAYCHLHPSRPGEYSYALVQRALRNNGLFVKNAYPFPASPADLFRHYGVLCYLNEPDHIFPGETIFLSPPKAKS